MALEMVEHEPEAKILRQHRHRFRAIHLGPLAHITLVNLEYNKNRTVKISQLRALNIPGSGGPETLTFYQNKTSPSVVIADRQSLNLTRNISP